MARLLKQERRAEIDYCKQQSPLYQLVQIHFVIVTVLTSVIVACITCTILSVTFHAGQSSFSIINHNTMVIAKMMPEVCEVV